VFGWLFVCLLLLDFFSCALPQKHSSRHAPPKKNTHPKKHAHTRRRQVVVAAQLLERHADCDPPGDALDWCAERLRRAGLERLAAEVELAKAAALLATSDVDGAVRVYERLERDEPRVR
jgi:hypothetical protein